MMKQAFKSALQATLSAIRNPQSAIGIPPAGLHHYVREKPGERTRLHLRVDPDGHGTLMINANQVVHLNPTATLMAFLFLEETPQEQAVRLIQRQYKISAADAQRDYFQFLDEFKIILEPGGCLTCSLDELEIAMPFSARPLAPYRMDLALTYRCNDDCAHCYNARPRDFPEMSTDDWKRVLDRTWELGIPHIVFTGGEPTLRDDLPELIAHAEANGQITGMNTNARRLSDAQFVAALTGAGLDHIQITVESHAEAIHDQMVRKNGAWRQTIAGLKNALASPLFVMTNTTMLQANHSSIGATLDFLADLGVPTIGLNALIYAGRGLDVGTGLHENELHPLLETAIQTTQTRGQRLIWYTPTQYCHFDPMQYDLGVKGCTAALYNMCVEPDGGVLPCQSYYHPLGNILHDTWDSIWKHELAVGIRERSYAPEACHECMLLPECGAGCPLSLEANQPALIPFDNIATLTENLEQLIAL